MDNKKYWDEVVPDWVKDAIAKGDVVTVTPKPTTTLELTEDEAYLVLRCLRHLKHDPMFEVDDQDKIMDVIDALLETWEPQEKNLKDE